MWRCDLEDVPCRKFCESKYNKDECGVRAKMINNQTKLSKQLLSQVLNIQEARNIKTEIKDNLVHFTYLHMNCGHLTEIVKEINIYELAHKCKVWANHKKGISIKSFINGHISIADIYGLEIRDKRFVAQTESKAVLDACEWILENKFKD